MTELMYKHILHIFPVHKDTFLMISVTLFFFRKLCPI